MAELRDDVVLDFSDAIREINRVERLFESAFEDPVDVHLDIDRSVADAIRKLDVGLQDVEDSVRGVNSQLSLMESAADASTVDVRQLASALGVSEDEARSLVRQFAEARADARLLEDATRGVATQLGLAENDADALASSMRRAATASEDVDRMGQQTTRSFNTAGLSVGRLVAGIGSALILVQSLRTGARFISSTFEAASDAAETLTKTEVVFGRFSDDLVEFSSDAPAALGLANREALAFASTFGNLFVSMGLTQEAASTMSQNIVTLGADLGSFNNIDVDEALIKLRAGLVGEFEALRTVGVALNATIVEQKAYELGLAGVNGELTEAAKIQARYALIVEQTTLAQGDFERTAEGVANRQRTVNAEFENFKEAVGVAFLPVLEGILSMAPDIIEDLERLIPSLAAVAQSFADSAAEGGGVVENLIDIARVGPGVVGQFTALLSSNPFFTIAEGVAAIADGRGDLTQFGDEVSESIGQITHVIDEIGAQKIIQGLIDDLRMGADPASALANHLAELTRLDLDSGDVSKYATQMARIAGLDPTGIEAVVAAIREQAESIGLDAVEVQLLVAGLHELNAIPPPPPRSGSRGGGFLPPREEIDAGTIALREQMSVLIGARVAAEEAGMGLSAWAEANVSAVDAMLMGASAAATLTFELALAADETQILADALHDRLGEPADFPLFADLPEQMGVITGQIEDETGAMIDVISTSAEDVLAQIQKQNANQAAFEANLVALAAAGAGALARRFAAEGPAAADAAADFVANINLALEAEEELTGTGTNTATAYGDAIDTTLRGLDFTDPALAAVLLLAEDLTNPTALAAIDAAAAIAAARYRAGFGAGTGTLTLPTWTEPGSVAGIPSRPRENPFVPPIVLNLNGFRAEDVTGAAQRAAATAAATATNLRNRAL